MNERNIILNFAGKIEKMLRLFVLLAIFVMQCGWCHAAKTSIKTDHREIRAVWLTTIGGLDWPRTYAHTTATIEKQKRELIDILDRLQQVNINTVLLQVRIRATTIFPSSIEPWDGCMSGQPGVSPGYDPLAFAIEECHKRNMEIHAWIVSIPVGKWNGLGCRTLRKKYPQLIRNIGGEGYMNPEKPQTAEYLAQFCSEVVKKYNVDGIHLDYIRYPETWKRTVSAETGRRYITTIVERVSKAVKTIRPEVKMSCSPIGKFTDLSRYSSRGWNAYTKGCQDAQEWLHRGLMDQLYPMIYFRGDNFYPFALDWAENSYGREVAAGLGIYFLDPKEGNWKIDEVKRQLNVIRTLGLGQCFFRAKFLLDNYQGIYDYLRTFNFPDCWSANGFRAPDNWPPQKDNHSITSTETFQAKLPRLPRQGFYLATGDELSLPANSENDAHYVIIETLQGAVIATMQRNGNRISLHDIPNGTYWLRSLGKKGITHRLGMLQIKRGFSSSTTPQ